MKCSFKKMLVLMLLIVMVFPTSIYAAWITCTGCGGSGSAEYLTGQGRIEYRTCNICSGRGGYETSSNGSVCNDCHGSGSVSYYTAQGKMEYRTCTTCGGNGYTGSSSSGGNNGNTNNNGNNNTATPMTINFELLSYSSTRQEVSISFSAKGTINAPTAVVAIISPSGKEVFTTSDFDESHYSAGDGTKTVRYNATWQVPNDVESGSYVATAVLTDIWGGYKTASKTVNIKKSSQNDNSNTNNQNNNQNETPNGNIIDETTGNIVEVENPLETVPQDVTPTNIVVKLQPIQSTYTNANDSNIEFKVAVTGMALDKTKTELFVLDKATGTKVVSSFNGWGKIDNSSDNSAAYSGVLSLNPRFKLGNYSINAVTYGRYDDKEIARDEIPFVIVSATETGANTTTATSNANASNGINVMLNGRIVNFADQQPIIQTGRTLVPVRGVFEELGFTVEWDNNSRTATLKNGNDIVVIPVGSASFTANGKTITPDVPAQVINGRTMLPLRAICESLGSEVNWDGGSQTAIIDYKR